MSEQEMRNTLMRIGVKYLGGFATAVRLSSKDPYEARVASQYSARLDTIYRVYAALELGSEDEAAEAIHAEYEAKKTQEGISGWD